jgi:hypothetical protein
MHQGCQLIIRNQFISNFHYPALIIFVALQEDVLFWLDADSAEFLIDYTFIQ